jgi:hypothetical protein
VDQTLRITGIDRATFADFWRSAGMGDPGPNTHAYSFHRAPGGAPLLRVTLRPLDDQNQATQTVTWKVLRDRAELRVRTRLTSPSGTLALLEWDVPEPLTVDEVTGPDVYAWSRAGARLQVWLRRSGREVDVELSGWGRVERGGDRTYACPLVPVRLVSVRPAPNLVRVVGGDGLVARCSGLKNVWPLPDTQPPPEGINLLADPAGYAGRITATEGRPATDVRVLTSAEVADGAARFVVLVDVGVPRGDVPPLTVRVRHWQGDDLHAEVGPGSGTLRPRRGPGGPTWGWSLPGGGPGHYRVQLTGQAPLRAGATVRVPELLVEGAGDVQRWVAVAGGGAVAEVASGLALVADRAALLRAWPAEAGRVRRAASVWQVVHPDWRLDLTARSAAGVTPPVQVLLADHTAAVLDGRRWVHQAVCWLYHEAGTDLSVTLPERSSLVAVALDGTPVAPVRPKSGRLWLPLAGPGGARALSVRWVYPEGAERLDRPNMQGLRWEGVGGVPCLLTVHTPPGYVLEWRREGAQTASAADLDLRRAEAQLRLSERLGRRLAQGGAAASTQLFAAQERFYLHCRYAEDQLGAAGVALPLPEQLQRRDRQLAHAQGWEATRDRAERQVSAAPAECWAETGLAGVIDPALGMPPGTPSYWFVPASVSGPRLLLLSRQTQQTTQAAILSVLLASLLLVVWGVSLLPGAWGVVHALWPEQVLGLGCVAWFLLGPNWGSVTLGAVYAGGRLFLLARWLSRRLLRRTRPPLEVKATTA